MSPVLSRKYSAFVAASIQGILLPLFQLRLKLSVFAFLFHLWTFHANPPRTAILYVQQHTIYLRNFAIPASACLQMFLYLTCRARFLLPRPRARHSSQSYHHRYATRSPRCSNFAFDFLDSAEASTRDPPLSSHLVRYVHHSLTNYPHLLQRVQSSTSLMYDSRPRRKYPAPNVLHSYRALDPAYHSYFPHSRSFGRLIDHSCEKDLLFPVSWHPPRRQSCIHFR